MGGEELTALIGAYEPGPGGLRALAPLAGTTLVEHQARRAVAAGAGRVLLLVDEMPAELAGALGRLRADGLDIGMAQGVDAAADALTDGKVLLIADACLPETATLKALSRAAVPTLAVVQDRPEHARYERIDAEARWAGAALIDGHRVAETAAMLGSWDPVSTLLRRAVQEEAGRMPADEAPPILLGDADSVEAAERGIVAATRCPADDWPGRYLFAPGEELVLPFLLSRRIEASLLVLGAAALALLGAGAAWAGWRWPALLAVLLSGPMMAAASRLARVQARSVPRAALLERARELGMALTALGLSRDLALVTGQWGWWLVGGLPIMGLGALAGALRLLGPVRPLWLASADALVWTMLPFALGGWWGSGLAVTAAYALLSFAWAQWSAVRRSS